MDESDTPEHDARLLARLAAGSEAAFAELYRLFGARLYRTALRLVGRREDAEDAVQDLFAALVRSRGQLAEVRDLPAYLFAALRRQAYRRSRLRKESPQTGPIDPAYSQAPDDPRAEALALALARLPGEQREVIALKIEGELTFAEIGRVLAISPNTAASRYRYALERLREALRSD